MNDYVCEYEECPHRMHLRCPGCNIEMYALAVWAFSHGNARCSCGYKPTPEVMPQRVTVE